MSAPATQPQIRRWAEDAQAALREGRADAARMPLQELAKRMPQHPGVLLLRRWAAAVEFDWPAVRAGQPLGLRTPPPADAIDLVLFHIDLPIAPSGLHERIDYLAVAALSFEAAARRAPRTRRILLTDEETRVPDGLGADEVIRHSIASEWPMYERMRVQGEYLSTRAPDRATVFMDVDVVVNRDPSDIFAKDFDVGLTWRPEHPDAPINGGLIFVGPGQRGHAFFQAARRCYDALAANSRLAPLFERNLRGWWGDQLALAVMVGYDYFTEIRHDGIAVDGTRVGLFPCDQYNFTPDANDKPEALAGRHFLHFKGNRKPLQARYLDWIRATPA